MNEVLVKSIGKNLKKFFEANEFYPPSDFCKLSEAQLDFEVQQHENAKRESKSWKIVHNLESFGLLIEAAFQNFHVRVDYSDLTIEMFCAYIMSKDPENIRAYPKALFEEQLEEDGFILTDDFKVVEANSLGDEAY